MHDFCIDKTAEKIYNTKQVKGGLCITQRFFILTLEERSQ